jgi:hypothetical protein
MIHFGASRYPSDQEIYPGWVPDSKESGNCPENCRFAIERAATDRGFQSTRAGLQICAAGATVVHLGLAGKSALACALMPAFEVFSVGTKQFHHEPSQLGTMALRSTGSVVVEKTCWGGREAG